MPRDPGPPAGAGYPDAPSRSPWVAQLPPNGPLRPLEQDARTDVAIVGAGIAGVATAFFVLRATHRRVLLLERDRAASGATGHNAGQLTTYFERPLFDIADEFGAAPAVDAQRAFDGAHELLDIMAAEAGAGVRIERFTGHMGMFTLNHVSVHLRNNALRRAHGLPQERCFVSEAAPFRRLIPAEFAGLYEVVPQAVIRELLDDPEDHHLAVLSDRKGCANSALLVIEVLAWLERRYPDRFRVVDGTPVDRVAVGADGRATVHARGRRVTAEQVVLCTNGYTDHRVEDASGAPISLAEEQRVAGVVGYMAAWREERHRPPTAVSYIRNLRIGGETPYVYVTRRTWDTPAGATTLTCVGGPERPLGADERYDAASPVPGRMLDHIDADIRPYADHGRPPGRGRAFQWHGLMGYSRGRVRVVGAHPDHPALLYNLGCNGVGFLPSIAGGQRIARLLAGETLPRSIFDPR